MQRKEFNLLLRWAILLQCVLHGAWASRTTPYKLLAVKTNCTRDSFNIHFDFNKPFRGAVYAKDFRNECKSFGNYSPSLRLSLATSGCGVRSEILNNGNVEQSIIIVIQMDNKLRQRSDVEKVVKCTLPQSMMSMNVITGALMKQPSVRKGRMRADPEDEEKNRIKVWLELGGSNGSGSVKVGELTTLNIRAILPASIGIQIVDCAALDGLGDVSQRLLDDRGCPIDEQVMPALNVVSRPVEEGWSKIYEDDKFEIVSFTNFPAFKFPDRERLHISCGVQLCRGKCPEVNCASDEPFTLSISEHLARIEVFNSLAVTAPLIELDNFSNVTVGEVGPRTLRLRNEGTLCVSPTKLAIVFCILGLIFLVAIIVALCCLMRSRSNHINSYNGSIHATTTSLFSSSSSTRSMPINKYLIPYARSRDSLPYGRVF